MRRAEKFVQRGEDHLFGTRGAEPEEFDAALRRREIPGPDDCVRSRIGSGAGTAAKYVGSRRSIRARGTRKVLTKHACCEHFRLCWIGALQSLPRGRILQLGEESALEHHARYARRTF